MIRNGEKTKESLLLDCFFDTEEVLSTNKSWISQQNYYMDTLKKSIARNIDNILNTKNTLTINNYLSKNLTFIDFGVPDILTSFQSYSVGVSDMEKCIQRAIEFFEPRIELPKVKITISEKKQLFVYVEGRIRNSENSIFENVYNSIK